jgi:hypothetical protein
VPGREVIQVRVELDPGTVFPNHTRSSSRFAPARIFSPC